ncbi:MAG: SUMF1/EgtB/PvdO family nonheme iron enzyme [Labilithrix sp.]|nr:SUMF1/EgtB/PvdO family nonheme iron enzyme [Labilithrix sp.]
MSARPKLSRMVVLAVVLLQASTAQSDEVCDVVLATTPAPLEAKPTSSACPEDMLEVEGDFCPFLDQVCLRRPRDWSYRCLEYRKSGPCQTRTAHKHFCIDKYEWPNRAGEEPVVMKDWYEAGAACKAIGKRLCTQDEWTLACEGPEHLPYPYGQSRDATACNIDKPHLTVDEKALRHPGKRDAEVARLWQGEKSGSRERCVSPFGVHDMTGNVDEWTVNETGKPHKSALKGGYWSWVRGRCRAVTPGHEEDFRYYQIGWRCCADAPTTSKPSTAVAEPASAAQPITIVVPAQARGHRIYVDEKVRGVAPAVVTVPCGPHVVRLGAKGRSHEIDGPCGGRFALPYP